MEIKLSKKQKNLYQDIVSENKEEIYVLGSTQSGKTFDISLATIEYCQRLHKYDKDTKYYGAIIGWTTATIKGNIVEPMEQHLANLGYRKKVKGKGDYVLQWSSNDEKYIELWNIRLYFFGFNNQLSFNQILGKPLIYIWVDESARIYSQKALQESFDQLPGRQMSFAKHPYLKTIHSFNVERK